MIPSPNAQAARLTVFSRSVCHGPSIMARIRRHLMVYLLPLALATLAVYVGDCIGCFMGLRGWWRVGLAFVEALIGLMTAMKLAFLTTP